MSTKKKPRIIMVEGCPCEVLEARVESGVVEGWESRESDDCRALAIAPDGSLFLAVQWYHGGYTVSVATQGMYKVCRALRRMARELSK